MKIYYVPFTSHENDYAKINIKSIQSIPGCKVEPAFKATELKLLKKIFLNGRSDITILNWLENLLISENNNLTITTVIYFFSSFLIYRIKSRKLIYVRHNLYPHGMSSKSARIAKICIDIAEFFCTEKVALSGHMKHQGYTYLPHPLYQKKANPSDEINQDYEPYYIIFGRITPYKKIEDIIYHWNAENKLIIAGPAKNKDYLIFLKSISMQKNIFFIDSYLPDDKAMPLVAGASGLIIAHAEKNVVVSGSFFYAATLGIPVFALRTHFLTWVKETYNYDGLFCYKNCQDLVNALTFNPEKSVSKSDIQQQAIELFGTNSLQAAWVNIINKAFN